MINQHKPKILLVEDEPHLAFSLELNLKEEGYEIEAAARGDLALEIYQREKDTLALIVLDWMIPEPNGYEVAKAIRHQDRRTPIVMLTARASDSDRIAGLELGIDDYICKPFQLRELLLKIRRLIDRERFLPSESEPTQHIECNGFSLDKNSLELKTPTRTHKLTALEADVLWEFMIRKNEVLTREYLLSKVWGTRGNQETRTVDNFIMRIRKFVETNPSKPMVLESVRGRGYRFNEAKK